jgi:tetratricopeptide (TPR) repeat protein
MPCQEIFLAFGAIKQGGEVDKFMFITILAFAYLSWVIFKLFIKPLKTSEDYIKRAIDYEFFLRNKSKAIIILKKALNLSTLTNLEKANILIEIGILYYKRKQYLVASKYFDRAFELILKEPFLYDNKLIRVLKSYIYSGQKQKAMNLYNNLLERETYDPKFRNIKKVEKDLF